MVLHVMGCKRPLCHCMRVTHPHRPGSYPLCEKNPMSDALIAALMGATEEQVEDVIADIAWHTPGKPAKVCPF